MEIGKLKGLVQGERKRRFIIADARISKLLIKVAHSRTAFVRIIAQNDLIAALICYGKAGFECVAQRIRSIPYGDNDREITGVRCGKQFLDRLPIEITHIAEVAPRPGKRPGVGER